MSAPFLLDTCAALWIVRDEISKPAADALSAAWEADETVYVSPISAWEIGVLASRGQFKSPNSPQRWWQRLLGRPGIGLCELAPEVLLGSSFLPGTPPRDPADRIIAATAREYGFTLLTRDRLLLDYAVAGHLHALAC